MKQPPPTSPTNALRNGSTPLAASLTVTAIGSLGTGLATAGIYFILEHEYQFSTAARSLAALLWGVCYIPGAFFIGPALRRAAQRSHRFNTRLALAAITTALGFACIAFYIAFSALGRHATWPAWAFITFYAATSGGLWPIVESFVSGGRKPRALRIATGRFNIIWSSAVVASLLLAAPLFTEAHDTSRSLPMLAVLIMGVLHIATVACLPWFPREPGSHAPPQPDPDEHTDPVADRQTLRALRIQLPFTFLVIACLEPLLPTIAAALALPKQWQVAAASTWMASRVATFVVMERWHGWHAHRSTVWIGSLATTLGFTLALLATTFGDPLITRPAILFSLALFGTGIGIIYAAALYFAMHVGDAKVDAGGTHETLIGLGYTAGPALGLIAAALARSDTGPGFTYTLVSIVALASLVCLIASLRVSHSRGLP